MTVSAALLVKDPPLDRLALLVEYLRPVVSKFVVVVDDRTAVETIDTMSTWPGVTLVPFGWVDDFAQARNAALPHCTGDWILHVDPDELPSVAMMQFIAAVDAEPQDDVSWQGQVYRAPLGYLFLARNFPAGVRQVELESDWHCRLFKRHPRNRWYKPVHEQVMLDGQPEDTTRRTPILPKAPKAACLIHAKPADRIMVDHALYTALEGVPA